jgi:hypothetical protein
MTGPVPRHARCAAQCSSAWVWLVCRRAKRDGPNVDGCNALWLQRCWLRRCLVATLLVATLLVATSASAVARATPASPPAEARCMGARRHGVFSACSAATVQRFSVGVVSVGTEGTLRTEHRVPRAPVARGKRTIGLISVGTYPTCGTTPLGTPAHPGTRVLTAGYPRASGYSSTHRWVP